MKTVYVVSIASELEQPTMLELEQVYGRWGVCATPPNRGIPYGTLTLTRTDTLDVKVEYTRLDGIVAPISYACAHNYPTFEECIKDFLWVKAHPEHQLWIMKNILSGTTPTSEARDRFVSDAAIRETYFATMRLSLDPAGLDDAREQCFMELAKGYQENLELYANEVSTETSIENMRIFNLSPEQQNIIKAFMPAA